MLNGWLISYSQYYFSIRIGKSVLSHCCKFFLRLQYNLDKVEISRFFPGKMCFSSFKAKLENSRLIEGKPHSLSHDRVVCETLPVLWTFRPWESAYYDSIYFVGCMPQPYILLRLPWTQIHMSKALPASLKQCTLADVENFDWARGTAAHHFRNQFLTLHLHRNGDPRWVIHQQNTDVLVANWFRVLWTCFVIFAHLPNI